MFRKPKIASPLLLTIYGGVFGVLAAVCPTAYHYNSNGYCYGLSMNALSFLDASTACFQAHRGVLAGVASAADESFITQLWTSQGVPCVTSQPCQLWLGWTNYHYKDHNGSYYWMDFKTDTAYINGKLPLSSTYTSSNFASLVIYNGKFTYSFSSEGSGDIAWPLCTVPAANNTGPNGCSVSANWTRLTPSTMYHFDPTLRTTEESKCFCHKMGAHPFSISSMAEVVYVHHLSSLYNTNGSPMFIGMGKSGECTHTIQVPVRGYGESFTLHGSYVWCSSGSGVSCQSENCWRATPHSTPRMTWEDFGCSYASHMYATVCESFSQACPTGSQYFGAATTIPDALDRPCSEYATVQTTVSGPVTAATAPYILCPSDPPTTAQETTVHSTVAPTTKEITNHETSLTTTAVSAVKSTMKETFTPTTKHITTAATTDQSTTLATETSTVEMATLQTSLTPTTKHITTPVTTLEATTPATETSIVKLTTLQVTVTPTTKDITTPIITDTSTVSFTDTSTVGASTQHTTVTSTMRPTTSSNRSPTSQVKTGGTTETTTIQDTTHRKSIATTSDQATTSPANSPVNFMSVIVTEATVTQVSRTSPFLTSLLQSAKTTVNTTPHASSSHIGNTTVKVQINSSSSHGPTSGTLISKETTGVSTFSGPAQTKSTMKKGAPNSDEMLEIRTNNSKFPMVAGVVAIALMVTFLTCCVAADAPALFASLKYGAGNVCSFFGRCREKRKRRKKPKSRCAASNARVSPAVSSN